VLRPFVSEQNHWMVQKHAIFQGYYYFHLIGLDREMRDRYRDHEWFDYTAEFCAEYDQNSFDAAYDTLPLEHFEPLVRDLMSAPRRSELSEAAPV
jgi:predicted HD phosphohydrolase